MSFLTTKVEGKNRFSIFGKKSSREIVKQIINEYYGLLNQMNNNYVGKCGSYSDHDQLLRIYIKSTAVGLSKDQIAEKIRHHWTESSKEEVFKVLEEIISKYYDVIQTADLIIRSGIIEIGENGENVTKKIRNKSFDDLYAYFGLKVEDDELMIQNWQKQKEESTIRHRTGTDEITDDQEKIIVGLLQKALTDKNHTLLVKLLFGAILRNNEIPENKNELNEKIEDLVDFLVYEHNIIKHGEPTPQSK